MSIFDFFLVTYVLEKTKNKNKVRIRIKYGLATQERIFNKLQGENGAIIQTRLSVII